MDITNLDETLRTLCKTYGAGYTPGEPQRIFYPGNHVGLERKLRIARPHSLFSVLTFRGRTFQQQRPRVQVGNLVDSAQGRHVLLCLLTPALTLAKIGSARLD